MSVARIFLSSLLIALSAVPDVASACMDGSKTRYYFLRVPPVITPDIMFVRVTIISRTYTSVEARLDGRFAELSDDGLIHIALPELPPGTNCVEWGDLEGPVYVVASSALVRDGRASIIAKPVMPRDLNGRVTLNRLRRRATIIYLDLDFPSRGTPPPASSRPEWWGTARTLRPYNRDPSGKQ